MKTSFLFFILVLSIPPRARGELTTLTVKEAPAAADLRSVPHTPGLVMRTAGYARAGDGGGGEWRWESGSTATHNGGTVVQVTGVSSGRWMRVHDKGVVNVRWFGAKGDGASDDCAAITAAMQSLPTTGDPIEGGAVTRVGTVLFPSGDYRTSQELRMSPGMRIKGVSGRTNCRLGWTANAATSAEKFVVRVDRAMISFGGAPAVPQANFTHDVHIEDLEFHSDPASNPSGSAICFAGAQMSSIRNVVVGSFSRRGIVFQPQTCFVTMDNVWVSGGGKANPMEGPGLVLNACNDIIGTAVSVEHINYGLATVDGELVPAVSMLNSKNCGFATLQSEGSPHFLKIHNCQNMQLSVSGGVGLAGMKAYSKGVTITGDSDFIAIHALQLANWNPVPGVPFAILTDTSSSSGVTRDRTITDVLRTRYIQDAFYDRHLNALPLNTVRLSEPRQGKIQGRADVSVPAGSTVTIWSGTAHSDNTQAFLLQASPSSGEFSESVLALMAVERHNASAAVIGRVGAGTLGSAAGLSVQAVRKGNDLEFKVTNNTPLDVMVKSMRLSLGH